jgi:hypothetical protein
MPITISCSCGKNLRVKDELAGKRIKCPACAGVIPVPAPPKEEPELVAVEAVAADEAPREAEAEVPQEAEGVPLFWADPNAAGGKIIALSDDALFVADLGEKEFKRARSVLGKGAPVPEVLEAAETVIPFDQMSKVQSNLYHGFIDVTWEAPDAKEATETNVLCPDKQTRDVLMEALHGILGWKREVIEYSRLKASWPPLVVIGLFGALTFFFLMAALHPEQEGGGKVVRTNWLGAIFVWVFNFFGPFGVVLLGLPFVLAGVAWLVMRMIHPPIMLTLTPRPAGRSRRWEA